MQKLTHVIGGYLAGVLVGVNPWLAAVGALVPDIDYPIRPLHRKLLHNVWTAALAYFLAGPALAVGVLSHLVLDSLTPMGVNWCWPVLCPRIRGPIRTGSVEDWLVAGVSLAVIVFFTA